MKRTGLRMKSTIARLAAYIPPPPKPPDGEFDRFTRELRIVVGKNIDGMEDFGFDEYQQVFTFNLESHDIEEVTGTGIRVEMRVTLELDPSKHLEQEIVRLMVEAAAFRDAARAARRAIFVALGGVTLGGGK